MVPRPDRAGSSPDRHGHSDIDSSPDVPKTIRLSSPIRTDDNGLTVLYRGRRGLVRATQTLHRSTWDTVLCEGVPISLRELILLSADRLGVDVNMRNAHKLLECSWYLGWHVTNVSSKGISRNYWGGGVTPRTSSNYLRGDWVETNVTDLQNGVTTSRLARVICGVQVCRVRKVTGLELPDTTWETADNKPSDTVSFLLVRYAQGHRQAGRKRGPKHRPLCPGILSDTHCLWSWTKRGVRFQRGCLRGRAWDRNKHFFGDTDESQTIRKELEEFAWYDLIQTSEVTAYANVQSDPDRDQSFLQSVMWC
jgi:hypothetical protein